MTIEIQVSIARKLWSIHEEIWPDGGVITWEDLNSGQQTAWLAVARFIIEREQELIYGDRVIPVPDHK